MSNYTTQMDAARKGIVTPEIEKVAKKEKMDVDKLMELVASGKVAIPANKHHKSLDAEGVGSMLRTKNQCKPSVCQETARTMMWRCRRS